MMKGKRVEIVGNRMYSVQEILATSVRGQTDIGGLASKDDRSASIMIWNYHDDDRQAVAEPIRVTMNGLPSGAVTVTHYRIDQEHSNSYEAWKKMGSPQQPTKVQIETLETAGHLKTLGKPDKKIVTSGELALNITLPRQGVSLLKLDW